MSERRFVIMTECPHCGYEHEVTDVKLHDEGKEEPIPVKNDTDATGQTIGYVNAIHAKPAEGNGGCDACSDMKPDPLGYDQVCPKCGHFMAGHHKNVTGTQPDPWEAWVEEMPWVFLDECCTVIGTGHLDGPDRLRDWFRKMPRGK